MWAGHRVCGLPASYHTTLRPISILLGVFACVLIVPKAGFVAVVFGAPKVTRRAQGDGLPHELLEPRHFGRDVVPVPVPGTGWCMHPNLPK